MTTSVPRKSQNLPKWPMWGLKPPSPLEYLKDLWGAILMGAQTPQWVPSTMHFANLAQSVLVLWLISSFTQKRENKGYFWVGLTTKIGQN